MQFRISPAIRRILAVVLATGLAACDSADIAAPAAPAAPAVPAVPGAVDRATAAPGAAAPSTAASSSWGALITHDEGGSEARIVLPIRTADAVEVFA